MKLSSSLPFWYTDCKLRDIGVDVGFVPPLFAVDQSGTGQVGRKLVLLHVHEYCTRCDYFGLLAAHMNRPQVAVSLVVLAIAPWVVLAITRPGKPVPWLVAIPAEARDLSSEVASGFEHAPFFVLADLQASSAHAIPNPFWRKGSAMGLKSAYLLLDQGVGAVLVKRMQPAAHNALYSRGVHIFDGNASSVLEAIQRFQSGLLSDLGPPKLPHHIDASHIPMMAPPSPCAAPPPLPPGLDGQALLVAELGLKVVSGSPGGCTVVGVLPGSRAERAGLQQGDFVVAMGQTVVTDATHLQWLAARIQPGSGVMLTIDRSGNMGQVWILPEPRRLLTR